MIDFDAAAESEKSKNGPEVKKRTGIIKDPRYTGHCMGPDEPECPERLDVLYALLQEPELDGCFQNISPCMAAKEDLARVHSADYIDHLETTSGKPATYLDEDTRTSALSNEVAQLAAGGLCRAIEAVHAGRVNNAFALIRPPGHHAERTAARGFCLYNNVAIAARFAQSKLGLARILVVDWDLHHGNGTQHCFEDDPSVLFFSTHQAFTYPHSGSLREIGKGKGKGYTVNVPLLPGFGDGDYLVIFERLLKPIALEFRPDIGPGQRRFRYPFQRPPRGYESDPGRLCRHDPRPSGYRRTMLPRKTGDDAGRWISSGSAQGFGARGPERDGRSADDRYPQHDCIGQSEKNRLRPLAGQTASIKNTGKAWPCHRPATPAAVPSRMDRFRGNLSRWIAYFKS